MTPVLAVTMTATQQQAVFKPGLKMRSAAETATAAAGTSANAAASLEGAAENTKDETQHRKLVDAAQQFEAMFLQEMLKPMNSLGKNDGIGEEDDGDNGDDPDGQNGTLASMGIESLAKAIAQAGGFGVANQIVEQVEREHDQREHKEKNKTGLKSAKNGPIHGVRRLP